MKWDPAQYARFADHRERPYHELVARVGASAPSLVLDVGCGPGNATVSLADRWPQARIEGVDSSAEMIERALALAGPRVRFRVADARGVDVGAADVVVSNAMLQWLPDHRGLLDAWLRDMRPGAWLAFQVPGNAAAPSHALIRELAARPRWREALAGVAMLRPESVDSAAEYAGRLVAAGWEADAWETTYVQWLPGGGPDGEHPVLGWVRGTGLRPVLEALGPDAGEFEAEYEAELRAAYPPVRGPAAAPVTALPFRRVFVVGHRPERG